MIKIIAEAGVNFRTLDEAFMFIDEAKKLNLFAVKFQVFNDDNIKDVDPTIQGFLKSIMLSKDDCEDLFKYGVKIGQEVFFTPMFVDAVYWISEIGCRYLKVRCKDSSNEHLLNAIRYGYEGDVIMSIEEPNYHDVGSFFLLCVPEYPADISDYLFWNFDDFNGFSDHTSDLTLLKYWLRYHNKHLKQYKLLTYYFEKHVMLDIYTDALEKDWSVTFSQLKEVLKE